MAEEPEATETTEIPLEGPAGRRIPVLGRSRIPVSAAFVLVATLSLLSGLGLAAMAARDPGSQVVAEARVGPEGGDIQLPGGMIRIPQGALDAEHTIRVEHSSLDQRLRVRGPDGTIEEFAPGTLSTFTFEPADLRFAEPVTIVLDGQGTVLAVRDGTVLFLPGAVDLGAGTVTFQVTDLSFRAGSIRP